MANHTEEHCPLSRCVTEPGYCATELADDQYRGLLVIVCVPLLLAFLSPIVASLFSSERACRAGGSCCHGDDDRPARAPMHRSAIDPPMFLGGVGLLPLECGFSGLLTIIWVMSATFVGTFFYLLNQSHPCSTALGECRTISCICGNAIPEGYVFMFCCLVLTSVILVQRISRMFHQARRHHSGIKLLLIIGALLISLTGIFPERYDLNGHVLAAFYDLHKLGVLGAPVGLVLVPYIWFFEHWLTHRSGPERVPLSSLLVRTVYFAGIIGFATALYTYGAKAQDETLDYCKSINNAAECEAWPTLPPDQCSDALRCVSDPSLCSKDFIQPNFQCEWVPSQLTNWTKAVAPKSYSNLHKCLRTKCPLYSYAQGVALEFGLLLLTLCYVSTFSLHDVRRLLNRTPRGSTTEATQAAQVAPEARGGLLRHAAAQDATNLLTSTRAEEASRRLADDMRAAGGCDPSSPPASAPATGESSYKPPASEAGQHF